MFRRDRRKNVPLFASILYISNPDLFRVAAQDVWRHLLVRHGLPVTLAEHRLVGVCPGLSVALRSPRPKMYRSDILQPRQVDYLYSELAWVAW